MIGVNGERESGKSVLATQLGDNDNDIYIFPFVRELNTFESTYLLLYTML